MPLALFVVEDAGNVICGLKPINAPSAVVAPAPPLLFRLSFAPKLPSVLIKVKPTVFPVVSSLNDIPVILLLTIPLLIKFVPSSIVYLSKKTALNPVKAKSSVTKDRAEVWSFTPSINIFTTSLEYLVLLFPLELIPKSTGKNKFGFLAVVTPLLSV